MSTLPAGYPAARLPSLRRRIDTAIAAVKAGGESIRAVKISAEGDVEVLTGAPAANADEPRENTVEALLRRRAG